ncbi:MAG: hypothetical protein WBK20_10350 [Spirochaetota bacterium]
MKRYIMIALVVVILAYNGCTKKSIRTGPLVCTMHGIHNCYNKGDIARCIGVDEKSIDDYYIFSESGSGDSFTNESKLKSLVCDKIVDEVMLRIQMIYSNKQFQRWQFTEMSLPVIFRTFVQKENHQLVVIGFVKKDDLSPKAIIYYLPLEYKMDIIGREKNNYKPQPDW